MSKLRGKAKDRARRKEKNKSKNDFFLRRKKLREMIRKFADPILKTVCDPVREGEDISEIVSTLKKVLGATDTGVGLAAPQVGYAKRIFAVRPTGVGGDISIFVNPEMSEPDEGVDKVSLNEGCLSYPGIYASIERPEEVFMTYETIDRAKRVDRFNGFESRIIQHEYDHLNGVCLIGNIWRQQDDLSKNGD